MAPISYEILKNTIQDVMDYLTDACKNLPEDVVLFDIFNSKNIISDEDINKLLESSMLYYANVDKDYAYVIRTIIKSNDKNCLLKALKLLLVYIYSENTQVLKFWRNLFSTKY